MYMSLLLAALMAALPGIGHAADPRESGSETVRRLQKEAEELDARTTGTYWGPFELARNGQCTQAIPPLTELAKLGRGYENAQHALGLCFLEMGDKNQGLVWIDRAADAGLAAAQATHLRLYMSEGTVYTSHETAAMWLYLYEANPLRLRVGAEDALEDEELKTLRASMPRNDYLRGIELARNWKPTFWANAASPAP